jgi:hypothetical protein
VNKVKSQALRSARHVTPVKPVEIEKTEPPAVLSLMNSIKEQFYKNQPAKRQSVEIKVNYHSRVPKAQKSCQEPFSKVNFKNLKPIL